MKEIRWKVAALVILALAITVPALLLSGNTLVAFAIGLLDATLVWSVALTVIEATGSSTWRMGAEAERWTAEELAKLGDRWRSLHAIGLHSGDVDHVAIGPGGVYALETKWTSKSWQRRDLAEGGHLDRAASQGWNNGRAVRSRLRGYFEALDVTPVVVLWGEVEDGVEGPNGDVPIVHGSRLASWLDAQPEVLNQDAIDGAAEGLTAYVGSLLDSADDPSRFVEAGAEGVLRDVGAGVTGGMFGFLLGSLAMSQADSGFGPAVGGLVCLLVAALGLRRYASGLLRLFGLGMAISVSCLAALVAAIVAIFSLS